LADTGFARVEVAEDDPAGTDLGDLGFDLLVAEGDGDFIG
jgi:hypothetical protein